MQAPRSSVLGDSRAARLTQPQHAAARTPRMARALQHGSHRPAPPSRAANADAFDLASKQPPLEKEAVSKCPFLAALPPPPATPVPWWRRLELLTNPGSYQADALAVHSVVQVPPQLGLPGQVVAGSADMAKTIFAGEAAGLTTVTDAAGSRVRSLIGQENLLAAPEPRHSYLRNLIMPSLSKESIERLIPRMESVLSSYLEAWAEATQAAGPGAMPVAGHQELRSLTFSFIFAVVMGRDEPAAVVTRLGNLFADWTRGILAWPYLDLPFTPFGRAMSARRSLLAYFAERVDEARVALAAGQLVPGILGSLVAAVDEQGNKLTDVELGDNLLLLLLAGHDTSSTCLTHVMARLHDNPAAMAKLRAEQAALLARHGPQLSGAMLRDMAYAEAVIRETLRLAPVVSGLLRASATDLSLGGYGVPARTALFLPLLHIARTDERWLDDAPDEFRPERMLTPEGAKPGAQMPFGFGPRFCAGYAVAMSEMKVFLALLARGYEFAADTSTAWKQELGQVPVNGLPMSVRRLGQPLA